MLTTKEEKVPKKSGVGVIVARFQVSELTTGHRQLIDSVIARHNKVIVILGSNGAGTATKNNPLDVRTRQHMVFQKYHQSNITIGYVEDCFNDDLWSRNLDKEINTYISVGSKVTLYGSRDSFTSSYSGSFSAEILEPESCVSGTATRNLLKETADKTSTKFREGVIWATQNQYPTAYPVIDVAIINDVTNSILLGKKENESLWRLPGGFVDPKKGFSENALEDTVKREAMEETSLEVADVTYVGSFFVDDWRYRSEADSMMSVLFRAKYTFGAAKAGDDLVEVKWFPLNEDTKKYIGPKSHSKMFDCILKSTEGKCNDSIQHVSV